MFNSNFYPTPETIVDEMIKKVDFNKVKTILEPSAGKGDIVKKLKVIKTEYRLKENIFYNELKPEKIDCIEIEPDLRHILKGNGFNIVHDDFLTFNTYYNYDLIIMNPPFSEGDKHLLKAIEMQERTGGQIVCLLNAETVKNQFSETRKHLHRLFQKYNADISFIENAFMDAERKTDVKTALIHIDIQKKIVNSFILDDLERAKEDEIKEDTQLSYIGSDIEIQEKQMFEMLIERYNEDAEIGMKFLDEYDNIESRMYKSYKKDNYTNKINTACIIEVSVNGEILQLKNQRNLFLKLLRRKYWEILFDNEQFKVSLTSNLLEEYRSKIDELVNYDFSVFNINQIKQDIDTKLLSALEETILNLYFKFTSDHVWYPETKNNSHYYDGWSTNKIAVVHKKVIIPLNAYSSWDKEFQPTDYKTYEKIADIEKVFNYLDEGKTENHHELKNILHDAEKSYTTKKIECKFFFITFYKKGTIHIEFKDNSLVKKLNIFAGKKLGGLPFDYGSKPYSNMSDKEKNIVDVFEGKKEYEDTTKNNNFYTLKANNLLMIETI